MGKKNARLYRELRKRYQEQGDHEALGVAHALLREQQNLAISDRERLSGYLEGAGRLILREPEALLTPASKMPGLDGQKMSKSYNNTIALRDDPADIQEKLRTMPTDPARVRRTDPGNPDICPVWQLHQVYSDAEVKAWVRSGCTTAGIGCLDCKQPVIDSVLNELGPIQQRAQEFEQSPGRVRAIINEGCEAARDVARETLDEVREVMGLKYL
jgi:tryptophanyl-tRNA synthetase